MIQMINVCLTGTVQFFTFASGLIRRNGYEVSGVSADCRQRGPHLHLRHNDWRLSGVRNATRVG